MAKPIKLITELKGEAAKRFKEILENPKPNPKRKAALKKARELDLGIDF